MSSKIKMHPELNPENNNQNGAGNSKPEETKQKWSEKHPKIAGFFKSLPKKMLSAGKKILGGILIVGGGIVLGVVGLEVTRPRKYGEFQLQLPETKHPALPIAPDVTVEPAPQMTMQEAEHTFWEAAKADPEVEVKEF